MLCLFKLVFLILTFPQFSSKKKCFYPLLRRRGKECNLNQGRSLSIYRNVALVLWELIEPLGGVLLTFVRNLELTHVDDEINPHSLSLNENQ